MAKLLRFGAYLLGALLLLVVVALVVVSLVIDPNDYKDDIAAAVESQTGRQLTMAGDLGLSVFPWLALEIGPTTLANAPGFSDRPFAQVKQVSVRIKLLPLLRKKVEMDTVVLDGLQLSMETDAGGKTNWADLAASGEKASEAPVEKIEAGTASGNLALAGLAIGGVKITDAAVLWDDRQSGAHYQLSGLSLRTGAIEPGATVPIELAMQVDTSEPEAKGQVTFATQVGLSDDAQTIQLEQARLKADLTGAGLPGSALKSTLGFDSTLNLATGDLQVPQLTATALGLTLEGQAQGKNLFAEPVLNAVIKLNEFVPRAVIKALGQPLPEVSDATVLGKADASLKLSATADSAKVSDLRLRFDDSALEGDVNVTNFNKPAIRFNLHLDEIDVDRYLPPPSEEPPVPVTPTTAAVAGAQLFPLETLRALNINGSLKIDRLKAYQLKTTDIVMKLVANGGVIRVHPAQAKMYQGGYDGDLKLDARGRQAKISMNEKLTGVQIGPLLKDLTGKDTLSGATRARATLTAAGQTPEALKKSLNGKINFAFENGAVKGFNLAALIRKAQAALSGQTAPEASGPDQTDFSELSGSASVTNGVIHNSDLMAKSPLLRVQGQGDVDLPAETLDYVLTAKIVGSLKGQGGQGLTDLKGVSIPVQISGSFAEPQYKVRLDSAVKQSAEKKIKKKLEKKLEKKFGDQFKGLFQ